jgi:hypothetical protein
VTFVPMGFYFSLLQSPSAKGGSSVCAFARSHSWENSRVRFAYSGHSLTIFFAYSLLETI